MLSVSLIEYCVPPFYYGNYFNFPNLTADMLNILCGPPTSETFGRQVGT